MQLDLPTYLKIWRHIWMLPYKIQLIFHNKLEKGYDKYKENIKHLELILKKPLSYVLNGSKIWFFCKATFRLDIHLYCNRRFETICGLSHNDFLNFDAELYAILNDMLDLDLGGNYYWNYCGKILVMFRPACNIPWSPV